MEDAWGPKSLFGRENELRGLESFFRTSIESGERAGAQIYGPTGIGKTAFAREFADRNQSLFPAGNLLFARSVIAPGASEDPSLFQSLSPLGSGLVILDEADSRGPEHTDDLLAQLWQVRPLTSVLLVGYRKIAIPTDTTMPSTWLDLELDVPPDSVHLSGLPGTELAKPIVGQLRAVSADLVERITARPELVHQLSSRQFEEFVAGLYERHGFEVELTPASKDGGVDLYAVRHETFGRYLTVVECKRNARDRPVGVELVRSLYGVVQDKGASVGVLATTSSFTAGAKEFQQRHEYRLGLQDWFDLQGMLRGPKAD
jgi:hypothetical protein